ncbi:MULTISPECIES: trehalose-phosphatase [Rhodomicrobium]|uniref:trehalose-phosphatase n=1 Tax=Rhodomicrobium TaxID=1068 RepID=UPI000B4B6F8B|nr:MULTISPECIES: trehalose-phosphatase [Rhodomicrobium]
MALPDPSDPERLAFFFDFDGTLADIVERPEAVEVTQETRETLARLRGVMHGAVAIITGRDIGSVDHFLAPLNLPVAGVHGLSRRDATGHTHRPDFNGAALSAIEAALRPLVEREKGLLLELKQGAVALHYRQRPELEAVCREAMASAAAGCADITLKPGKMVIEAVGHRSGKGAAIDSFLQEEPFRGRVPVFVGDDLTDEDGFVLVNGRGGISIKVGHGDTSALYRVEGREALLAWLETIIEKIGTAREHS